MTAAPGISTSAAPANAVVQIQPGMEVQPVVLVDQNGQYVTPGGSGTATTLASATTDVNVSASAAPTSGQVLTATSGTVATWQNAATGFANPMTTVGDSIAENTVPTAVRVSGNTTATKNFYTQTGTGSASALPVWGTIAAGDVPFAALLAGAAFAGEVTVQAPVNASDAVTKSYADAIAQGLSVKPSVQEATAAALPANTYSNGASGVGATLTAVLAGVLTVDGIAVALGDRVLVQNEAAPANNGIYTVTTLGTVGVACILTRAVDMNTAAAVPGAFAFTEQGTVNAGAGFTVASAGPFTIGTTAITWTQFSGAGEITAGTGLSKSGNTLSLITPVAAGNLPTGTTSTKGALQLDGTASHILANGVQAAGSNGTPADSGHIHPYESFLSQYQVPTGATAETLPRGLATGISGAGNTGDLYVRGIGLPSGLPVNNITFVVSSTATTLADVTHGWYVLLDDNLVVRAVSADQTSGNWGTINTPVTLSVAGSSYTTTYSGLYYVGQMVAISAGSMPTFLQGPSITAAAQALTPALQGLSSAAQTTPPLTGATMATITPVTSANYYAYTS